ncbi:SCO family protein [Silvanigrella sp.]|jgi:protein SCO1/2|uniref:SCO family protein n=1 Tax=Silvanigrella sp. TaxID=2024976 RepID=UPI0037CC1066|nr:SCO family protein [Silvanigrellaceae bacterium]
MNIIKKCDYKYKFLNVILISFFQLILGVSVFSKEVTVNKNIPNGEIFEKLNQKIDLNLTFTNQDGQKIKLKDLFVNEEVVIFTLNYFKCTTMCAFQFVNLATTLKKMDWPIGSGFRIATISFDPYDTYEIAKEKQKVWVPKTGQKDAKWDFLVGDSKNINVFLKDLNFYYELDPHTGEYSHGAALFFIKNDGTFYRYLYGIVYDPQDIKNALVESSNGKLGSFFEKIYTKFKKFQIQTGKYASSF